MNLPERITVCEVGLRDGMQIEKTILTVEDKLCFFASILVSGKIRQMNELITQGG